MRLINKIVEEDLEVIAAHRLEWDRFRGKTILITGANGFLPAYMVEAILFLNEREDLGCRVIGLVRSPEKAKRRFAAYTGRPDLTLVHASVSEDFTIPERCHYVVHAASQASPKYYGLDPVGTMEANIIGAYSLLKKARDWGSEGFLYFSSGEVYGEVAEDKIPTREQDYGYIDIANPRASYAESKRASETMLVSFVHQFGVPGVIVRPFHTYGPGMDLQDGRVFADFVSDILIGKNIALKSDGSAVRAFCYLADAVAGYFTVLLRGEKATAYNVGNPDAVTSIADLAETLVALFPSQGLKVERTTRVNREYLASPVSVNIPNIDRVRALGWQPSYGIRDGFKRTVESFRSGF